MLRPSAMGRSVGLEEDGIGALSSSPLAGEESFSTAMSLSASNPMSFASHVELSLRVILALDASRMT